MDLYKHRGTIALLAIVVVVLFAVAPRYASKPTLGKADPPALPTEAERRAASSYATLSQSLDKLCEAFESISGQINTPGALAAISEEMKRRKIENDIQDACEGHGEDDVRDRDEDRGL
ncbi:hypothetical protein [Bradyrhizobium genosp. P]|uniref:hypothetical protein n=1 Tax=Bradyrhizobium genosp. P TaxID=83641 RepID=UPI003CF36D92